MIETILPPYTVTVEATEEMWDEPLLHEELPFVQKAVPKRRRDFQAGRTCARRALGIIGVENAAIPVGERRQPIWPSGYTGSITHTKGYCAATVAKLTDCQNIGIDAELNTPLNSQVVPTILRKTEQMHIHDLEKTHNSHLNLDKVIFSAKESIYKAFFPMYEVYLGFLEAELTLDLENMSFSARIHQKKKDIRRSYNGSFCTDSEYVYTSVITTPPTYPLG